MLFYIESYVLYFSAQIHPDHPMRRNIANFHFSMKNKFYNLKEQ